MKCHLLDTPLWRTAELTAAGVNDNRPAKDQVSHSPWKGTDYRQALCLTKESLTVEKVATESVLGASVWSLTHAQTSSTNRN